MKKILWLGLVLFGVIQMAFSQHGPVDEVVYLKNGSIVRGVIVEQVPNKSLKIQTADGNLFVFDMDKVERITKEPRGRRGRGYAEQQYVDESANRLGRPMGMVQFFGVGYQELDSYYDDGAAYLNYHFIYGYQFVGRFFVGGGIGMEHMAGDALPDSYNLRVPLFAAFKVNFTKTRVSPFVQLDAGYHFNTDDYIEDGAFLQPKLGVDFNLGWSKRRALFLSMSFVEYGNKFESNYYYDYYYNESDFYPKVGVNFGLRF